MARRACEYCGSKNRRTERTFLKEEKKERVVSTCEDCGRELYRERRKPRAPSKTVNWALFDKWTPALAWWLGAFVGDGNISATGNMNRVNIVGVGTTGQRWLDLVAPGKTPKKIHGGKTRAVQAYKDSKHLVKLMEDKFGYTPGPKSKRLHWPRGMPASVTRHFVRGLVDTDGCLSIERRRPGAGNDTARVSYTSICESFVQKVVRVIAAHAAVQPVKVVVYDPKRSENLSYTISWSGEPAMRVARWLYEDSSEKLRNEDRYTKYVEMCTLRYAVATATCVCGAPATREGKCQPCWWDGKRTSGPDAVCRSCGKQGVEAKGMCVACYKRDLRVRRKARREQGLSEAVREVKTGPDVACNTCGALGVLARGLCGKCYRKDRVLKKSLEQQDHGVRSSGEHDPSAPAALTDLRCGHRKTGPDVRCGECGRMGVKSRGLCGACYQRDRLARKKTERKSARNDLSA